MGLVEVLLSRPWTATTAARTVVGWMTRRDPIRFSDVLRADPESLGRMRSEVLHSRSYRIGRVVGEERAPGEGRA